jgi:hypothetical protein
MNLYMSSSSVQLQLVMRNICEEKKEFICRVKRGTMMDRGRETHATGLHELANVDGIER